MSSQHEELPLHPPAGKIRYKAIYVHRGANPFKGRGLSIYSRTADVDADVPIEQVEVFAREMQECDIFQRLEIVEHGRIVVPGLETLIATDQHMRRVNSES